MPTILPKSDPDAVVLAAGRRIHLHKNETVMNGVFVVVVDGLDRGFIVHNSHVVNDVFEQWYQIYPNGCMGVSFPDASSLADAAVVVVSNGTGREVMSIDQWEALPYWERYRLEPAA